MKPFGSGLLFAGSLLSLLLLQTQFHYYWLVCSNCLFLLDSVLAGCMFLEICPFFLSYPIHWHVTIHSILLWFLVSLLYWLLFLLFYFCGVSCNFSFFISDFIDLDHLLFFLLSLAKGLSILFIFSKNQLLVSLIFSIVFSVSISFISALILMISFL